MAETNTNAVVTDMVGRSITTLFPRTHSGRGDTVLAVRGLATDKKLKGVSFEVHAGEVVGIFGLLGAGRTELAKAIFGWSRVTERRPRAARAQAAPGLHEPLRPCGAGPADRGPQG